MRDLEDSTPGRYTANGRQFGRIWRQARVPDAHGDWYYLAPVLSYSADLSGELMRGRDHENPHEHLARMPGNGPDIQRPVTDAAISALRDEIMALRTSAETLYFSFDRILSIGLLVLVGLLGVGIVRYPLLLLALPLPVAIIMTAFLNLNAEGLSRAGHKRLLEEELNSIIGLECFLEERYIAPTRQGILGARMSVYGLQALTGIGVIAVYVAACIKANKLAIPLCLGYYLLIVFSAFVLVKAMVEVVTSYNRAYSAARNAFSSSIARFRQ
jgi:hypothetical protein